MQLFWELNEVYGQTILLITHDQKIAESSKRIIVIEDGKIAERTRKK